MARAAFSDGKYDNVSVLDFADSDIEDVLHRAYRKTQNIHSAWNKAKPCRSSMVGDIFKIGETKYVVSRHGFTAI